MIYDIFKDFVDSISKDLIDNMNEFGEIDQKVVNDYIDKFKKYQISFAKKIEIEAKKGNSNLNLIYGKILFHGYGVNSDFQKASYFFQIASDFGAINSKFWIFFSIYTEEKSSFDEPLLGQVLLQIINLEKNNLKKFLKEIVESDDSNDNYLLIYAKILFKENKKEEASKYIKKSADMGNIEAMIDFADMLTFGRGIPIDKQEGAKYWKMAADLGDIGAMNNYAYMMKTGDGIPVDQVESIKYFKKAMEKGSVHSMYNYGFMIYNGEGVDQNKEEGMKILKKAADEGDENQKWGYADILYFEDLNEEALKYYKEAADLGSVDAMYRYAVMKRTGCGTPADNEEAIKYYKMAIEKNHSPSMYDYANMIRFGDAIDDYDEMVRLIKMAIELNDTDAMNLYGYLLCFGFGVFRDDKQSLYYFKKAIDLGNKEQIDVYLHMIRKNDGIPDNKEEALEYYELFA